MAWHCGAHRTDSPARPCPADVDATARRAAELGGKVVHGPQDIPDLGRMAVIVNPQGAAINVIAYAPPAG